MSKINLSVPARALWGKLSHDGSNTWLPLWVHMVDAGEVAGLLWKHWLPPNTKKIIEEGIDFKLNPTNDTSRHIKSVAVFMAFAHDIGKATPCFQEKATKIGFGDIKDEIISKGLPFPKSYNPQAQRFTHSLLSEKILEMAGLDRSYAVVVGGHHGKPPNVENDIDGSEGYPDATGIGEKHWESVQQELVKFALEKAGLKELPKGVLSVTAQVLLSGFLIMADWIASGEGFPLFSRDYLYRLNEYDGKRASEAWEQLELPEFEEIADNCSRQSLYDVRFGIKTPRPMQMSSLQVALETKNPGIIVIEAPMGEGKTEAALAAAEVLALRYGMGGIYFALPTQATSDGIFKRIENWIRKLHKGGSRSIFLAHGKAGFNKDYEGIKIRSNICNYEERGQYDRYQEAIVVNDWTQGRKKGLLSDFVVGTIDQILMCGLKQKHLALRHLGIANKVVIIDECHAYDTYMSSYLDLVLSWLGAYHIPVIVLSATLPPHRRNELIQAYNESHRKKPKKKNMLGSLRNPASIEKHTEESHSIASIYPLISYTDGNVIKEAIPQQSGRTLCIKMVVLQKGMLMNTLQAQLSDGGCAGIICNTVQRAQDITQIAETYFGEENVELLHSRFISCDRVRKEQQVRSQLGSPHDVPEDNRPHKLIVVGTQVMEQSLDIDFDVLFTDICPMDLLLQRMGRLHRHARKKIRPARLQEATCFVMGIEENGDFEKGSEAVYGKYLLLKTEAVLGDAITMPQDIPELVQQVYENGFDDEILRKLEGIPDDIKQVYNNAKNEYDSIIKCKKEKAKTFQIKQPVAQGKNLVGWLKADFQDPSGKRGEATVRDTGNSLDVLVIVKKADGYMYTLPWLSQYSNIRIEGVPDEHLAKVIAGCSVSLPSYFTANWQIDQVIGELETIAVDNHLDNWYESYWLTGELFLVLNENYETILLDKKVRYNEKYGLCIEEMEV
jgi:CRISPR-associated endonuclease/helicase Cas3